MSTPRYLEVLAPALSSPKTDCLHMVNSLFNSIKRIVKKALPVIRCLNRSDVAIQGRNSLLFLVPMPLIEESIRIELIVVRNIGLHATERNETQYNQRKKKGEVPVHRTHSLPSLG
jgi:hypothetical protein